MRDDGPPVIGVTNCSRLGDYVTSVERTGARVRVLHVDTIPGELEEIDALVLTGGGDVDPALYGEARSPSIEDAEPGRDRFELDLARRALRDDLPLLAICRGAQVLNVAAGGSLIQDIPTALTTSIDHSVSAPADAPAHRIRVTPGTRLASVLSGVLDERGECEVNSRHHQAVARLGTGLVASATAADGIIEAVEAPGARYCLGVQWHPENFWRTGRFHALFEMLVRMAQPRARR